ncbi:UDP-glucose 4-epimerase GalE [Polynucleobacter sphagniphilus]|uniref:UDP-glucose 4-epimerase n=1 Tax=Polynucleobacter sphagniphilus TaxID=1743169 RepID=A0AA43M9M5_9BURK|nr:UDP-glucose 4-epimerase GalE [Polynucleobacter sphagniphilus]MDH6504721.1 UDP-glucose 4-epimerase [Polynucleobacter sphagniphilus]MDH6513455.1 UDP-glucose 4-epimerase [Polynucleobacter sphagniphilus]
MNILLTGGAGYIGSHTAVVLSEAGHEVVLLDNFCNSKKSVLEPLKQILGKALPYVEGDIRDTALVTKTLQDFKIDAVIHFAGLKAVGESVEKPIEYYANNVQGTISLLEAMKSTNVKTLVFSSSATVYGDPQYLPIDEDHPTSATNAYGRSKLHIEEMLKDVANSGAEWKIICLRYFNPVGAHESGLIGENPNGIPNNLTPYIAQVITGKLLNLNIYGNDYPTIDGTGVRDYIHVMDLAEGHKAAISRKDNLNNFNVINLGTGKGYSVLNIVEEYQKMTNKKIKCKVVARRAGDIAECYSSVEKAKKSLGWEAKRDLHEMCKSSIKYLNLKKLK